MGGIDSRSQTIVPEGFAVRVTGKVGVQNSSGVDTDPATETTLGSIKTQTDKLTFIGDKLKVDAVVETGDIEIGAVEIKDATTDTRATVGANGLNVDVKASVLPTGASTSAGQTAIVNAIAAIPATDVSALATSAKQDPLAAYKTQEIDDYTTTSVTYFGKMKVGAWLIMKIDETGNFPIFRYANVSNNGTLTTYALAWAARTTATYNYFDVLTF